MSTAAVHPATNPGLLDVVLSQAAYPSGIDNWNSISKDPCFCSVCCNLFAGSAFCIIPRPDIYMHETTGLRSAMAAKAKMHQEGHDADEIDHVPEWAGKYRADYTSWQLLASSTDMKARAEKGCSSCWILLNGVERLSDESPPELKIEHGQDFEAEIIFCKGNVLRVQVYPIEEAAMADSMLGFMDARGRTEPAIMLCEFYTLPGSPCPWPTIGVAMNKEYPATNSESWRGSSASHILANPNENNSLEIIEKWLEHCVKQHPSCHQELEVNNSSPLPKRVINVGPDDNSGIHIFEHDDENSPVKGQYVALSHCWGITKHVLTLKGNIDDWKKNIPWNKLHSTFQEAIAITRRLGIRYLWLDSFCIIQDDSKDWHIEAAKMGSIYSRAYLVIAATGSVDGDGGIFIKKVPYITLRGEDQHQKQFQIFVRHQLDHTSFGWDVTDQETQRATRYKYSQTLNPGYPLFTRAWCFQERVLGSRVLHFTRDELVFECISSVSCECGALADFSDDWMLPARNFVSSRHLEDASSDLQGYVPTLGNLPELTMQNPIAKGFSIFADWYDLASEYSEKQITRSTDWLPALAGLASKWEGPKTGNYLSGLWSKDLLRGLLWESLAPEINENPVYIAPSWSWASTQRPVHWIQKLPRSKYYVEINLQRTACIPKGPNKFGELAVGWLFIAGPVIDGILTSVQPGGRPRGLAAYVQSNGSTQYFSMDCRSRCSEFIGQKITCLRYCTDMSSDSSSQYNRTLMLAHVQKDDKELSSLPDNIRDFPNICRRIGIQEACRTDQWHFDSRCTLISMYII